MVGYICSSDEPTVGGVFPNTNSIEIELTDLFTTKKVMMFFNL